METSKLSIIKLIDNFINTEINERIFRKLVTLSIILVLLINIIVFLNNGLIQNYKVRSDTNTNSSNQIKCGIDSINVGRKYLEIQGWAYKNNSDIKYFNSRFVIRNESTKKYKVLKTGMRVRDALALVDEKYNCKYAGMYAKGISLGLKKGLYEVFIEYKNDNENILADTGISFEVK